MSKFECKVSELSGASKDETKKEDNSDNSDKRGVKTSSKENNSISETTQNQNNIYKLMNEKNYKLLGLIIIIYFLLHTDQTLEFMYSKIPSLMSSLTQLNTLGKIIFGAIIGVAVIIYSSFFQDL
jgi:hypothetical protein